MARTISDLRLVLGAFVSGQRGAGCDIRQLALCIDDLAKIQLEFSKLVHDLGCIAAPKRSCKIKDWIKKQGGPDVMSKLPALSIRQPWAWLILNAGKDVENRKRRSHLRGEFLIHASLHNDIDYYEEAVAAALEAGYQGEIPANADLPRGGIVGRARLSDCVTSSESPWFLGPYGYVLSDVTALPFVRCKGAIGFFRPANYE